VAIFAKVVVKFVAEAVDWRPVAATAFRAYLLSGGAIAVALWLLSAAVAAVLNDPLLEPHLRLFAVEIPLFAAFIACRNVLAGLGSYRQQALAGAARWIGRMSLIILFIHLGWAVRGAILGSIGGMIAAFVVALAPLGGAVFGRAGFPVRAIVDLAVPAFLLMLTVRLFDRVGLLMLNALRGAGEEVGYYSAAQNIAMVTGVIVMTVTPILISTVSAARRDGRDEHAREVADGSIRASLALLPFACIVAGAAPEIFALLFGAEFVAAAPLGQWLVFVAISLVVISVAAALLVAEGSVWGAVLLTAPLLPASIVGHLLLIPRLGALGAAIVTTVTALVGAVVCVVIVQRVLRTRAPVGTLARGLVLGGVAWLVAAAWPTAGVLVVLKAVVLAFAIVAGFLLLGELDGDEVAALRAWMARGRAARG
jgi:O-antigen/teichoic acid export membrane protein